MVKIDNLKQKATKLAEQKNHSLKEWEDIGFFGQQHKAACRKCGKIVFVQAGEPDPEISGPVINSECDRDRRTF